MAFVFTVVLVRFHSASHSNKLSAAIALHATAGGICCSYDLAPVMKPTVMRSSAKVRKPATAWRA
jgi:hypothetical protein